MLKAMLVDLDGTLVDTHEANVAAYVEALDEAGVRYSAATLRQFVGRLAWPAMLAEVLPDQDAELHRQVAMRKRTIYPAMLAGVAVNTALIDLLRQMKTATRLAVVTSASRQSAEALLVATGIAGLFDTVVTSDDVTRPKPDPEPYRLAAQRLGVSAGECLVLEDSDLGIAAANGFGAQVWRIYWTPGAP